VGYLIAAMITPIAGPAVYWLLHDHPRAVRAVDGFVYFSVPVLVVLQVLPAAWEQRSPLIIVAATAGLLLPAAVERMSHALHRHTDSVALMVGLSGLLLHTLLEGAALVPTDEGVPVAFALAVIVHQMPVGLILWWLLRPRYGVALAATGVGSIVVGTAIGYGLGVEVLGPMHGEGAELYQAFVSGSLMHVVFHQGRGDHQHD
jgi:hypothetical protein